MPNCFQLIRKDNKELATFQVVDSELCQHLGLPWDEKHWTYGWYDFIGLLLALGKSFQQITDIVLKMIGEDETPERRAYLEADYALLRINHYLLEHYDSDAWVEIGRR